MLFGRKGDLEKLKVLSDKYPENSRLRFYKARGYQELGEHDRAANGYEEAAVLTKKDDTKARYLANAAIEYAHAGTKERALAIVERMKTEVSPSQYRQLMLIEAMLEFARMDKDEMLQAVLLEQLIELRPGDSTKRFELAYKHSGNENKDMALYHYLKIPIGERSATAWNNLGVSFGEFGLSVKAITAFEKSADEGETLAMSNLGSKLLSAGFLKEAKVLCDKALAAGEYHQNVPDLARQIIEVPNDEAKNLGETLEKTAPKASFYRQLGAAALKLAPTTIGSPWKAPEGMLNATLASNALTLIGKFERPSNPFGSLAQSFGLAPTSPKMLIHRTIFAGEVRGNVVLPHVVSPTPPG
jgi:tetratricopeptide (TPR) repeat protein